jgi:hypothetical protein
MKIHEVHFNWRTHLKYNTHSTVRCEGIESEITLEWVLTQKNEAETLKNVFWRCLTGGDIISIHNTPSYDFRKAKLNFDSPHLNNSNSVQVVSVFT